MANTHDLSVLVVEDHSDTAEMLLSALHRKGIDAESVDSGEAALAHLAHHKPTVVLMDEMMPGMTGIEVVREMRQKSAMRDVSVLFYTASFDITREREAASLGAAWLVKGVSPLSAVTTKVLQLCQASQRKN